MPDFIQYLNASVDVCCNDFILALALKKSLFMLKSHFRGSQDGNFCWREYTHMNKQTYAYDNFG